jgi:drug/metabolite transporter (DMT)-like permease
MTAGDLLLGIAVMILWGLNFSVIKLGVNQIDPLLLTALRFTCATIPAVFFVKRPNVKWSSLMLYGWLFSIGVWGMTTWAIQAGLSAGMSAVLLQINVVIGLFLGYFLLKESISNDKIIGAVIAIMGLLFSLLVTDGSISASGVLLILVAALCWSLASITIKKNGHQTDLCF